MREAPGRPARMSKKMTYGCFAIVLGSLAISACSDGGGSTSSSLSVLDSCSGAYVCDVDGSPIDSRLVRDGGQCYLGSIELHADRTTSPIDGDSATWAGDKSRLQICTRALCLVCTPAETPVGSTSSSGSCTGEAESCSSIGASSCSDQGGCHYTIGSNVSSTSDDGCEGSPHPCSDYKSDAAGCQQHRGCAWR